MGSLIEFNDTLQITAAQGFPPEITLKKHQQQPLTVEQFAGRVFAFDKPNMRLYQPHPVRVHFVENIDGKWLYWGEAEIMEQTIHAKEQTTSGKFRITKIYTPDVQRIVTEAQAPAGKCYF